MRDEKGQKALVARVARYIAAPFRSFALPIDIRGTELQRGVWNEVRKIPFGRASTYSKIAEAIADGPLTALDGVLSGFVLAPIGVLFQYSPGLSSARSKSPAPQRRCRAPFPRRAASAR